MSLRNKTVVLIHPAWHSGGGHRVFCSQANAYRQLGAEVLSLAVGRGLERNASNKVFWSEYFSKTTDLVALERFSTGPTKACLRSFGGWLRALRLIFGNVCEQMIGNAELSPLPECLVARNAIDLIHCNLFYNMPLALRIKARFGAPIVLETFDIQAYQFDLARATSAYLHRRSSTDELLKTELASTAMADTIVHLNSDEFDFFARRLPENRHVLLYPAVGLAPAPRERPYFLIVAGDHRGNYLSVAWFLENVYPLASDVDLKIVGRVDEIFRILDPETLERYGSVFVGRVNDLNDYYDNATAVLLPIIAGHGLSIKTLEAMSTGVSLVATPLAFRGMRVDVTKLDNVWLAQDAPNFARCMREVAQLARSDADYAQSGDRSAELGQRRAVAATKKVHDELFSFESYVRGISHVAQVTTLSGTVR
jgi:glycosyltransferase involved in cell wall biosynthesis